jgi:hypothetical protein
MNGPVQRAEAYARAHVAAHFPATLTYHNIVHIEGVARAAAMLADAAKLAEDEREALLLAAWFHDLGMDLGANGHEQRSAELVNAFLTKEGASQVMMDRVRGLILATRLNGAANDPLQQLMRDADMAHLASENFPSSIKHLREEREAMTGQPMKKRKWLEENIAFVERTSYGSAAARALWDAGKAKNLAWLKEFVAELNEKKEDGKEEKKKDGAKKGEANADAKAEAKKKKKSAERGIETMFRVTLGNHTKLSQIADNKANIMLSVNALVISVTMNGLLPKLDNNPQFLWPTVCLLATSLLAIIFATIATIPKTGSGMTTRQQVARRERNILFFGNFHAMKLAEFDAGIRHLMENPDDLYSSMTMDLFFLGQVLQRKYRFLRITYTVFMIGLILTVGVTALGMRGAP